MTGTMFDFPSYEQIEAARREFLIWTLIFSMFWGAITGFIGSKRGGKGFLWFLLGAVIGPFALPFPFIFAGTSCPYCRKRISRQASICPYCRSTLTEGTDVTKRETECAAIPCEEDERTSRQP